MDAALLLKDLVLYSLQVGVVVGLAAFVPAALRLRLPAAKLAYWYILLAACLLVPLAGPWKQQVADLGGVVVSASAVYVVPSSAPLPRRFPFSASQMALAVLAAGAAIRLGLLAVGFVRLRGYRRRSIPLAPAPSWSPEADLRLSPDVASPVTFGLRRPVVLLPAGFPQLDSSVQDAILAHECLHVRRRDWVFTVGEELVRAVFWFHPAIWWVLGEIQLAREQVVDRAAVEMTNQREEYVDALLAIAGASPQMDLAPAPLFLRRRHLKHRVISIVKEVRMSKTGLTGALAVAVCILAAACWMATSALPLEAAPQVVTDGLGVSVDVGAATLMHRTGVLYPPAALAKGVEGTVVVQVRLDATGAVVDAGVLSGPQELRRAALEAVLQWHFAREYSGGAQQVSIEFKRPKAASASAAANNVATGDNGQVKVYLNGRSEPITVQAGSGLDPAKVQALVQEMRQRADVTGQRTPPSVQPAPSARIKSIRVQGLPETAQNELLSSLSVHEGDLATPENRARIVAAARQFDEHLSISVSEDTPGQVDVRIAAPGAEPPPRIRVGGAVQAANLAKKAQPTYPPLARQARLQGKVVLNVIIGKDGTVQNITVESGHALLVQAAIDAVRQWEYKPTLLNNTPVEVSTQVEVNFTLSQDPPLPLPQP